MAKVKTKKTKIEFSGFEDEIHLSEFIDFDLEHHVGAFILQKEAEDRRVFRFGFETPGIHSSLDEKRFLQAFQDLENGMKRLPFAENITFVISSFSESQTRIRQLNRLLLKNGNPGIRLLLESEKDKAREMERKGLRQPKTLRIYCTYTPDRTFERKGKGWQDSFFKNLLDVKDKAQKRLNPIAFERDIKALFVEVYQSGFMAWKRHIQERMGLIVNPLTADDLWAELWHKFSDQPPPPIPQVIRVKEDPTDRTGIGIHYTIDPNSTVSAATVLTRHGLPIDDDKWVKIKDRYVGVLTFIDKPGDFESERSQLSYLWNVLSRDDAGDMEMICQFKVDSEQAARRSLQRISAQSDSKQKSIRHGSDRMAARKGELAQDAEDALIEGDIPLSVGVGILIYRDAIRKLDETCATIASQFHSPAWVAREEKIAWRVWAQTLPTRVDRLLHRAMYNRTKTYRISESMAFVPIFKSGTPDLEGVELHTEDGSSVFINLFDFGNPLNMALFASTRSGKSVLVASFLLQALAHNIPIIAMDYPKGDGSSTFSDFTQLMGEDGAYYNIAEQCNNIFEQPDLREIDPDKRKVHQAQFVSSLKHIVLSLVGKSGDSTLDSDVKSELLPLVSEFLEREDIQDRYDAANNAGHGTEAWENSPTLHDFKAFVPTQADSESTQKAFDYIHRRLRYWLKSDIADAIAKPSTFKADAKLIVFALTNVHDDEDAAILGLAAYSAAIRRSLSYPASIFFIDESPILFEFPMISKLIASLTANFGKSGGRVILTAQTVGAIAKCGHADQILGNCKVKLVGCIEPGQEESFVKYLKMDEAQATLCSSEKFIRKRGQDWTNWMLSYGGKMYRVRFYAGEKLLYSVANNPTEQQTREYFMRYLPIDLALDATAIHLKRCESRNLNPLDHLPDPSKLEGIRVAATASVP